MGTKEVILANLSRRELSPRENENLWDAEKRWQRENDPLIAAAYTAGASMQEIAARVEMSTTAVGNSLRRSDLKPPPVTRERPPIREHPRIIERPVPDVDYRVLLQNMEQDRTDTQAYLDRLDAAITALRDCLPFLAPEPDSASTEAAGK